VDVAALVASLPEGIPAEKRSKAASYQRCASLLLDDAVEAHARWGAEAERLGVAAGEAEDRLHALEAAVARDLAALRAAEDRWRAAASSARKGHEGDEDAAPRPVR
jgi:hypothetical protein